MKYFKAGEFTCSCGCGLNNISAALYAILDKIRESANIPIRISSGSRCKKHNADVGGRPESAHLTGLAVDIAVNDSTDRYLITKAAVAAGIERMGLGKRLIHIDIDRDKPQGVLWLYEL